MRVLHIISSLDRRYGGPATAVVGLAIAQAQLGLKVAILATFRATDILTDQAALTVAGVSLHLIGPCRTPAVSHPSLKKRLTAAVVDAQVLHLHGVWETCQRLAMQQASALGKPFILRPCGMFAKWSMQQKSLKKKVYWWLFLKSKIKRAARIHFTTELEALESQRWTEFAPAVVKPNGLDCREFMDLPKKGEFTGPRPALHQKKVVIFLGRLHPVKNLESLLQAFAQVCGKHHAVLVLAGPDTDGYQQQLQAVIRDLKLESQVFFTGMLHGRERLTALRDASVLVLPSHHENFGMAVIEALAVGTPVVVSRGVQLYSEIAKHAVGQVVAGDPDSLAAAIDVILRPAPGDVERSERCRRYALTSYDWQNIARQWVGEYQRVLGD